MSAIRNRPGLQPFGEHSVQVPGAMPQADMVMGLWPGGSNVNGPLARNLKQRQRRDLIPAQANGLGCERKRA